MRPAWYACSNFSALPSRSEISRFGAVGYAAFRPDALPCSPIPGLRRIAAIGGSGRGRPLGEWSKAEAVTPRVSITVAKSPSHQHPPVVGSLAGFGNAIRPCDRGRRSAWSDLRFGQLPGRRRSGRNSAGRLS